MIFALITAMCWAVGGFGSSRIARHYGPAPANGFRLALGSVILAALAFGFSGTLYLPAWQWFALAGVLHLAIGDVGLFAAYRRLGPRMGVLMVCSLAPPTALVAEWLVLDTVLSLRQLGFVAAILVSVGLAVAPKERQHLEPKDVRAGILFGLQAAVAQGLGASMSRIAFDQLGDTEVTFWLPTLYRVGGGALGVWLWVLLCGSLGKHPMKRPEELIPHKRIGGHPLMWLGISTLLGPVVGMMFLMRAFDTTASALVQATLSTLPVFMIPVAWFFDGTRPSLRSWIAGLCAVGFTVLLVLMK